MQFPVLGGITGSGLLVEGLLGLWKGAGEPAVNVEFLTREEFIETEEEGLCGFRF